MCSCFHFQFDLNESIDKKSVLLLCFLVQFVLYIGPFLLETIGVSKLHNNLYLLSTTSCKLDSTISSILDSNFGTFVNNVFDILVITKPYLWHFKLGHASDAKLHALHDCIPNVSNVHSNKDCTLCPIAKQKRLPFPFFNHLSGNAFDLIHCDV